MQGFNPFVKIIGINDALLRRTENIFTIPFLLPQTLRSEGINPQWHSAAILLDRVDDWLIVLAYISILILLFYCLRQDPDLPLRPVLWLFFVLMMASGITHSINAEIMGHSTGWLWGGIKTLSAGVALYTVFVFSTLIFPSFLRLNADSLKTQTQSLPEVSASQPLEQEYESLLKFSPHLLGILSQDGYLKRFNSQWESRLGFSPTQLTTSPFADYIHPDDRAGFLTQLQTLIAGKEISIFEARCRCENNHYKWFEWKMTLGENGETIYTIASEITQHKQIKTIDRGVHETTRKKIETALQRYQERLEALVEERTLELAQTNQKLQQEIAQRITIETELDRFFQVCVDMLCIAGADGYYKRVNPAVQSILGYTEAEFIAQPSLNLIHPEDQAATLNITIEQMEQNKPILSFQNRYRCKDGSYKWLSWTSVPVPAQRVMYSIARDITQTKQAEAEIQHLNATLEQRVQERTAQLEILNQQLLHEISERQYTEAMLRQMAQLQQAILNSANYTIIATDPTGIIQLFNQTAEQLLGYVAEEVVGQMTPALIHDPDEIRHRTEVLSQELAVKIEPGFETFVAKARLGVADENEWSYIRKDGSRFPVQLSVTALFDAGGLVTGFLGIGSDITQRKAAQKKLLQLTEELKRSNQELEQFAYVASHDLQEPLRAVNSYAQLIQRRYQGQFDEKADKWFEYLTNGATRMQQLIHDLLSYSRVGTRGNRFTEADCNVILHKALDNLQVTIAEKQAIIESDSLPVVIGDAGQLVQLFQNLIGNGIKFCRDAIPQIYIGVQKHETEWVFQVRDNGIGIGDEYRERIFEIFQRLHSRREYAGTGIGLAICKRIVERHQGRIWVESHLKNAGSTFYFTISASLTDELT